MKKIGRRTGKNRANGMSGWKRGGPPPQGSRSPKELRSATGRATPGEMEAALLRLEEEISERRQTEGLLRESEARLKKILDSLDVGVAILGATTHTILSLNPKAAALFGAPEEQVVGKVCHQYICPALKESCPVSDLGQVLDASERILLTRRGQKSPSSNLWSG